MIDSGLYIHIPYCHGRCYYCDFYSKPHRPAGEGGIPDEYIDALHREFMARQDEVVMPPATIYIGGGTPSLMTSRQIERLYSFLPTANAREITIEVNPEDVTANYCRMLADTPVNRISMGLQSLNDSELKAIGRRHTAREAIAAVDNLFDAGFNNISLDLIYGLPGQTIESWRDSLSATLSFPITHLSAYTLMYETGTRLTAALSRGRIEQTPQEDVEQMYLMLCEAASERGLTHYEISNFGSIASQHNSSYWQLTPYLGIGAAAHSYDGIHRRANAANLKAYLQNPIGSFEIETPSPAERIEEYIMLRLRTADGLDLHDFVNRFGNEEAEMLNRLANKKLEMGLLEQHGNRISIPERHWLIADSIIVDLI